MPWDGVKFDAKGQNTKGAGLILELKGAGYQTVWPEKYRSDRACPRCRSAGNKPHHLQAAAGRRARRRSPSCSKFRQACSTA